MILIYDATTNEPLFTIKDRTMYSHEYDTIQRLDEVEYQHNSGIVCEPEVFVRVHIPQRIYYPAVAEYISATIPLSKAMTVIMDAKGFTKTDGELITSVKSKLKYWEMGYNGELEEEALYN